jgi:hypothetical protein
MGRYFIGVVMVLSGILLLIITKDKNFKEVEVSVVMAYSFLFFGTIYLFYKIIRKR